MEIVEGIHRIDEASSNIAHSNVYLVINKQDLFVVDTGTKGNADKIVKYVEKLGRQPREISTIILTHYHMDHAGSAKDLKDLTCAKVAASIQDAELIAGEKPYPKPKNLLMRAASFIKPPPVDVDIPLKDGDTLGGLTVLLTPGHTAGSIMLLDKEKKVLFSGDTLRQEKGKVTTGPGHFTWDESKQTESVQRIAGLDFDVLLPGHGEVLVGGASVAVKKCSGKS
jgi:glyoxylase-like metal-dependent hydrolase (beta-lactamase superfamily II)